MLRILLFTLIFQTAVLAENELSLNNVLGEPEWIDTSGSLGFYYRDLSNRENNQAREEFGNAQMWLKAVTKEWHGMSLGISALHNMEFADEEAGFNNNISDRKLILAELFFKYSVSKTEITLGRHVKGPDDGGWIMLDDYYEGVFIESEEIDDVQIRLAWVNRSAVFDPDEVTRYGEFNGDNDTDGVYGAEVSWTGVEDLELSALYYRANGAFSFAGARAFYSLGIDEDLNNEFLVEYYSTWENGNHGLGATATNGNDKAGIFHINNTITLADASLGFGYIKADRKLGSGSLINNPWDPFEEDDFHTQLANANTFYVTGCYHFADSLSLNLVYGETKADVGNNEDADFRQLNAILTWEIHEQISLEAGYVHIDTSNDRAEGFDKYFINTIFFF